MAKLTRVRPSQAEIERKQRVRLLRSRYAQALSLGYGKVEAARLAQALDKPIPKPQQTAAVEAPPKADVVIIPPPTDAAVTERHEPVQIAGTSMTSKDEIVDSIPPNYSELPWPQLRDLAKRIHPDGVVPRSRVDASRAIEEFLAGS